MVQELGCEPSLYRFNSVRSPLKDEALESTWWWSLTVDQVVASSILVKGAYSHGRHPAGRKARRRPSGRMKARAAGEMTRLKTAGVNALRGSSPWSSASNETNSPVAQRRRHLPSLQKSLAPSRSTVRVRPGLLIGMALIRLVRDMSAKHVGLSSNLNGVS